MMITVSTQDNAEGWDVITASHTEPERKPGEGVGENAF